MIALDWVKEAHRHSSRRKLTWDFQMSIGHNTGHKESFTPKRPRRCALPSIMHCSLKPTLSSRDQFGANICVSLLDRRAISSQVPKWGKTGRFAARRSSAIRPPRGIARRISPVLARMIAVACSRPLSRTAVATLARPVLLPRRSCQHLHPMESVPWIDKLLGKPASPLAQERQDYPIALSPRKTGTALRLPSSARAYHCCTK